jgi:precorrin-3B synthase
VIAIAPKGWCPGVYEPMATGDGLLVRIKPPNATLRGGAARQLAESALRHGNGVIELTNRGGIQVRGLQQDTVQPFAAAMVRAGLVDADPETERRRAVIVAPLANARVLAVATRVEQALCSDPGLAALPTKFAVTVDGDDTLSLGDIGSDIRVMCGTEPCSITCMTTNERKVAAMSAVPDGVRQLALSLLGQPTRPRVLPRMPKAIGPLPSGAFGLGLPFGTGTAAILASLADLSEACGDGTLRITPWRACIIPGISVVGVGEICAAGVRLGLIVDPADPRLAVAACLGQPACSSATVPARTDAMRLAELGLSPTVHVSGCAKGCAHPGPARVTIVGENGRYGIVRNGGPGETPLVRGLSLEQVMAALEA